MNFIKQLREQSGKTQIALAESTGLSLRTIQRLESSNKPPKGHSLKVLALAFNLEETKLRGSILSEPEDEKFDKSFLQTINLSILGFFVFPFGNILLPYFLWKRKKTAGKLDEAIKKIINFQILWSIGLCFSLCISPFLNIYLLQSVPLILVVLFSALIINLIICFNTANYIQNNKIDFLNLPLRMI